MKKHNFNPGPAILPAEVIQQSAEAVRDFQGSGLSILEISHRDKQFEDGIDEAVLLIRKLLNLPEQYEVLFLTGGASSQFFMAPMNLLDESETAAYVDTGTWSSKAIKEAKLFGNIEVVASSKNTNYNHIPKQIAVPSTAKFLHITSNNTIFGTQYQQWPSIELPLVADMSSDFLSKPVEVSKFQLIYAGAQKNLGPAGVTVVIVDKEALGKVKRKLPAMLDYRVHIENKSLYNTAPVFPIYVCLLTLRWLDKLGGLTKMDEINKAKAKLLYDQIDRHDCFIGHSSVEDRSLMNVTFNLKDPSQEESLLKLCKEAGCVGVKGHRSAGGFRASIYNAMPLESVEVLANVMREFGSKHG